MICLIASLCLHAFFLTYFTFYLKASGTPAIFSWPEILTKTDLLITNRPVQFDRAINFSRASIVDKSYFLPSLEKPIVVVKKEGLAQDQLKISESQDIPAYSAKETDYLYLWEKPKSLIGWEKETIQYKAFVSPYGKVIISFPTKLPVNSSTNMSSQDYTRQAAMFLKNRFLWTKVETVVR